MENRRRGKESHLREVARHNLFELNKERLEQLAFRAMQRGLAPNQFLVVCIDVDDPSWTEVVDTLMPDHDWQQYRDRGEKPVARGTVMTTVLASYLGAVVPDIETALTGNLPQGVARTVVMGAGGASVYLIEPTPQYKNN